MPTQTTDNSTKWYQKQFSEALITEVCYPEEDYQVAAIPKQLLHAELAKRLNIHSDLVQIDLETKERFVSWKAKRFNFSAVSDPQLMHHLGNHLNKEFLDSP